jgi:hypothetical protein
MEIDHRHLEYNFATRNYTVKLDCGCKYHIAERQLIESIRKEKDFISTNYYLINCLWRYINKIHKEHHIPDVGKMIKNRKRRRNFLEDDVR